MTVTLYAIFYVSRDGVLCLHQTHANNFSEAVEKFEAEEVSKDVTQFVVFEAPTNSPLKFVNRYEFEDYKRHWRVRQ